MALEADSFETEVCETTILFEERAIAAEENALP
jgi:hypothetical protein